MPLTWDQIKQIADLKAEIDELDEAIAGLARQISGAQIAAMTADLTTGQTVRARCNLGPPKSAVILGSVKQLIETVRSERMAALQSIGS
jgi:hypothetical protein